MLVTFLSNFFGIKKIIFYKNGTSGGSPSGVIGRSGLTSGGGSAGECGSNSLNSSIFGIELTLGNPIFGNEPERIVSTI